MFRLGPSAEKLYPMDRILTHPLLCMMQVDRASTCAAAEHQNGHRMGLGSRS